MDGEAQHADRNGKAQAGGDGPEGGRVRYGLATSAFMACRSHGDVILSSVCVWPIHGPLGAYDIIISDSNSGTQGVNLSKQITFACYYH
jgi:hypothetical protein